MSKERARVLTNFSKGELSPLIEGRPDLAAFFEGGRKIENWRILRQGGLTRRPGTRMIREVKDSTKDTILMPVEVSETSAFALEQGDLYTRFIKNRSYIVQDSGEKLTNGTFDVDANWSKNQVAPGVVTIANGVLRLNNNVTGRCTSGNTTSTLTIGLTYRVTFQILTTANKWGIQVGTLVAPFNQYVDFLNQTETGLYYFDFTATATGCSVLFRSDNDNDNFTVDNVSVQCISPYELTSPYAVADIRAIHFTQSVDVVYLFHRSYQQRKLNHVADANWNYQAFVGNPPPSFEADTDISGGTVTLTPGATTGLGVTFTASASVFLAADVGRLIIFGTARAEIKTQAGNTCTADIIDAFPNTNPIPAGSWFLRLSPQTTLDPTKSKPIRSVVVLAAGVAAFRAADVGKFIVIYAGLVQITAFTSATSVTGIILSEMTGTALADPAAAPAGAWTLEVASWSSTNGWPGTGEFYQGRLGQASTNAQKTSFWLSESDNFEGYAVGATSRNAIEYAMATRQLNRIEWLADNIDMFIGTTGAEHRAQASHNGEPIGGDVIPLVEKITTDGCAPVQPTVISRRVLFMDRSRKKVFTIAFDINEDGYDALEITAVSEHIAGTGGFALGPTAFARRPDPCIYYVRSDGELVVLTFLHAEKVIGFSRFKTDGLFKSVCAIPSPTAGDPDQIYVIVERTINGVIKKYLEMFDSTCSELSGRAWQSLQTDCATVYQLNGIPMRTFRNLSHLEGKAVDIVADGVFVDQLAVQSGKVILPSTIATPTREVEIGLHYDSIGTTMRPGIVGKITEGLLRSWITVFARVFDTIGGTYGGIKKLAGTNPVMTTGDVKVEGYGNPTTDGAITFKQTEPYPMTVLALFGEIEFSPHA